MIFLLIALQFGLGKRVSYSCSPGFYWTGQTCLPCSEGCKCSSYLGCDDDIICDPGYALQTEKEKKCVACPTGCSYCLVVGVNGFVCNQCSDGYQLIGNICIPLSFNSRMGNVKFFGFGLWGIPSWSVPTDSLPKGIAEAYSTLPCVLRDSRSSLCTQCPDGSWLNEFLQCEKCSPNCKLCTSRGTCVTCETSYFWNAVANENKYNSYFNGAGECWPCKVVNATSCSNTGVAALTCVDGAYINNGTCIDCITGCKTCGDGTTCINCFDGYYLNSSTCQQCVGNTNIITSCLKCSDSTTCSSCSSGYMLINSQCIAIPSDIGCESFKVSLTNTVVCGVCLNGYYLNQGTCYPCNQQNSVYELCYNMDENTQAPSVYPTQCITNENNPSALTNYFLFQQVSQEVNTNVCVENVNGCIQISNINGQCSTCAQGYTLGQGQCYQCSSLLNCVSCSYTTQLVCNQCAAATYNLNNECLPCYDGCNQCQSANDCQVCSDGYYFDGQSCTKCSVNNCKECNANSCTLCLSQFFLYQNTCQLCPPGCAVCDQSVGRQCTLCLDGFHFKNGGCYPGSQYCASYYLDGSCKRCVYGAYASEDNECLPCVTLGAGYVCGENADINCYVSLINFLIIILIVFQ